MDLKDLAEKRINTMLQNALDNSVLDPNVPEPTPSINTNIVSGEVLGDVLQPKTSIGVTYEEYIKTLETLRKELQDELGKIVLVEKEQISKELYSTEEAHKLIFGDREKDYGSATKNFTDIAKGWSVIFGTEVTAEQVCIAMTWLKLCRLIKSPAHRDSVVDGIGYLAIIQDKLKNGL